MEAGKERQMRIEKCAQALEWAMENVEELRDDLVKRYVLYVKGILEDELCRKKQESGQSTLGGVKV